MNMYSPTAVRHLSSTTMPRLARPLGRRTQMMARGPGWRLAEGEAGSWYARLDAELDDPALTWTHLLRTIRGVGGTHGLRPLMLDLRAAPRLSGEAAKAAALLVAEFERQSLPICAVVGPDLVHAARLHRLLGFHSPTMGRCFLTEDEGVAWIRHAAPLVAAPPIQTRTHSASRPHLCAVVR